MPECFFAYLGNCEGPTMVKAHLVPKSRLRIELRSRGHDMRAMWDERTWVWCCGGTSRLGGHHGAFDAKQIRLNAWPEFLIEFLREYDLGWMAEAYAR